MKLLITGGTGFLGKYLINEFLNSAEKIYVLTSNKKLLDNSFNEKIEYILGDITSPELIFRADDRKKIRDQVTHCIHAAALYDFKASHKDLYIQNVIGTQNTLSFSKTIDNLTQFVYISTYAVSDLSLKNIEENKLYNRSSFEDDYSRTKYLAEKFIRESSHDLKFQLIIIRPGIIVADSITGDMGKVDGPYYFINAIKNNINILQKSKYLLLSYNPDAILPIIPVDHCARYIRLITERSNSNELNSYHLISDEVPTVQEFLTLILEHFGLNVQILPVPKNPIYSRIIQTFGIPKSVIPFMFSKATYDKTNINKLVPEISESKFNNFKSSLIK